MIDSKCVWKIDPIQSLANLESGIRNKALRIALNAGAAPMKAAVINHAPSRLGNLKKAMRIKIKNYRQSNAWVAVIGASTSFKRKSKSGKAIRPAIYQPIVNEAKHFMEHALKSAQSQFAQIVRTKLAEVIQQLINSR